MDPGVVASRARGRCSARQEGALRMPSRTPRRTHLPVGPSCCHGAQPTRAAAPGTGPGSGAETHLFPLAQLPRPPLTPLGYTLYLKGYRPQGQRPGAHRLSAGSRTRQGCAPAPQTRPAAPRQAALGCLPWRGGPAQPGRLDGCTVRRTRGSPRPIAPAHPPMEQLAQILPSPGVETVWRTGRWPGGTRTTPSGRSGAVWEAGVSGISNALWPQPRRGTERESPTPCCERLGGLLQYYAREAAYVCGPYGVHR
jgi:hypothetical protein